MTVSAQTTVNSSTGNGVTTVFPYAFKILSDADIEVLVDGVVKTLASDYTVSGVGDNAGGNITFLAAPAAGAVVVRRRNMQFLRATDYQNQGDLPSSVLNPDLDAPVLMAQQLQEQVERSVRGPAGEAWSEMVAAASRLDKLLVFDSVTGLPELSTVTQTQVASAVAAAYAAGSTADAVTFLHSGLAAVAVSVQAYLRSFGVSATAFGVPNDGTEGATEMAALLAAHGSIHMPTGSYLFSSPLTLRNGHKIVGAGRLNTIITSGVIGDSLFKNSGSYTGFWYLADMQLIGNGLTGSSGNGHAINMIDPAISSGSFTPAQCVLERLYIRDFRGNDVRDNSATAVQACAIICVDGLGNVFRDISIETCGHGIYLHLAQNCRIENPLITGCDGWGIHTYDTENTVIWDGDVNTCGTDGVTDPTGRIETGMGTGNVLDARNEGFTLVGMKVKGSPGTAQMHSFISSGEISSCWIRPDHVIDKEFIGVLITQPVDVSIHDNDFSPTSGATYSATRKITNVKASVTSTHNVAKVRVNDNQFRTQSGTLVRANVHLVGASSATRMEGFEISGNSFGMPLNVASATTIDTDVLLDTGAFANGIIRGNNHYTATNVTKTAHYELLSATYLYNDFDCNSFSNQVSGAIAGTFSGFTPGLESISAAKTFGLNDGNRVFLHPSADTTARTWQIPANSTAPYAIGTKFTIINQDSAGVITLAVVTDTIRLAGAGTTGNRSIAANGRAVVEKVAATEWIISGTGVT